MEAETLRTAGEPPNDLGFGAVVARESRQRLLNRDGSFNVRRRGLALLESLSPYHALLATTWPRFLAFLTVSYFFVNAVFAAAFVACGDGALGPGPIGPLTAFFFSVQTFSTIGYGQIVPTSLAANAVVTLEALVGMLWLALAFGLVFARFSRPTARVIFSRQAAVAPYRGISALMFRIANARSSQLIDVTATVLLSLFDDGPGKGIRRFHALRLERDGVVFFPLTWTVVHPIDDESPLRGLTAGELAARGAEVLILLTAIDEASAQRVYARSSYVAREIAWNARFADVFDRRRGGDGLAVDLDRMHDLETPRP